ESETACARRLAIITLYPALVCRSQTMTNPLLAPWTNPFAIAPFDAIRPEHFEPAYAEAYAAHKAEIEAIATNPEPATFANTAEAIERSGDLLDRVSSVFWNLVKSNGTAEMQALERVIVPRSTEHWTAIMMDERLYHR